MLSELYKEVSDNLQKRNFEVLERVLARRRSNTHCEYAFLLNEIKIAIATMAAISYRGRKTTTDDHQYEIHKKLKDKLAQEWRKTHPCLLCQWCIEEQIDPFSLKDYAGPCTDWVLASELMDELRPEWWQEAWKRAKNYHTEIKPKIGVLNPENFELINQPALELNPKQRLLREFGW